MHATLKLTASASRKNIAKWPSKLLWIRFNRLLAWTLLISPAMHILWGVSFVNGLLIDLVLLLAHGLLSLALFGAPKSEAFRKQHSLQRFLGGSRAELQGRERFLLDAWRILISVVRPVLLVLAGYAISVPLMIFPMLWLLYLPLASGLMFFQALWAVSMLRHVRDASSYAYRRWRLPAQEASVLGWLTLVVYVCLTLVNLFKELL
jgi:hypothetical protein